MLKYKKMFALSVIIAVATAFFLPGTEYGFGWPIAWIEVHGKISNITSLKLFHMTNVKYISYNLWNLLLGSFIIYGMLLIAYKGLNKLNKDTEIGEKTR